MTREIKFRGKKFCQDEWIYGSLITRLERGADGNFIDTGRGECYPLQQDTIGQFTGLHDKNGKEIYEGDILVRRVINDGWGTHDKEPLEVVFMNGAFGIRLDRGKVYEKFEWICKEHYWSSMGASGETKYEYEVIGNIYDNPELLKEN